MKLLREQTNIAARKSIGVIVACFFAICACSVYFTDYFPVIGMIVVTVSVLLLLAIWVMGCSE